MDQLKRVLCAVVLMLMAVGSAEARMPTEGKIVDAQGHPAELRAQQEAALQSLEAMSTVAEDGTYAGDVAWVAEYIRRFVALNPTWAPNKVVLERADALAQIIVDVSREVDVDYRVATVIVRVESGFREGGLKGKIDGKDHGLMQVHKGKGTTSEDQLREGLGIWTACRQSCKGLESTMTCYAIGRCAFPTEQGNMSLKAWQRLDFKKRGITYRMKLFARSGLKKNRRFASIVAPPVVPTVAINP